MATTKLAVIDANVLLALVDRSDKWHTQAIALLSTLKSSHFNQVYFDCVLNETISVIARRAEEQKRTNQFPVLLQQLIQRIPKDNITWVSKETERLYHDVIQLVQSTSGKLNFHDALIALACKELGITMVVSFDKDFDTVAWITRVAKPGDML